MEIEIGIKIKITIKKGKDIDANIDVHYTKNQALEFGNFGDVSMQTYGGKGMQDSKWLFSHRIAFTNYTYTIFKLRLNDITLHYI